MDEDIRTSISVVTHNETLETLGFCLIVKIVFCFFFFILLKNYFLFLYRKIETVFKMPVNKTNFLKL